MANIAKNGIKTINSFFSYKTSKNLKTFIKKTDIIIAANVICHIPNLKDLIRGVDNLLSTKGLFISEEPYLGSMFKRHLTIKFMMNISLCFQ